MPDGARPDLSKTDVGPKLAKQLLAAKQSAIEVPQDEIDAINAKLKKRGPLQMPQERDIGDLSREEQVEVASAIQKWQRNEERAAREANMPDSMKNIPGMREVLDVLDEEEDHEAMVAAAEEAAGPVNLESLLINSPYKPMPKKPMDVDRIRELGRQEAERAKHEYTQHELDHDQEKDASWMADQQRSADSEAGGSAPQMTHCPHCGHDVNEDALAIDSADKLIFLQEVILGGGRFRKEYQLMGGHVRVVFRSLTPDEAKMARRQAVWDASKDPYATPLSLAEAITDYRLLMAIDTFERVGGEKGVLKFNPIGELDIDSGEQPTALPEIGKFFSKEVFNTESLQRVLGQRFAKFNRLLEALEAKADHESFWMAIE